MAISVLVADARTASRQETVALLQRDRTIDVIGDASDGREAVEIARTLRPAIVLLDGSIMGMDTIAVVESLQVNSPESGVIVVIDGTNLDLMRSLMRAGARDCLARPVSEQDLLSTIHSVDQAMQKQREASGATGVAGVKPGSIIAVYSPQGGSGKSMLAANLGVALARETGSNAQKGRVALVDLNLQFGDIDLMLNLNPENTIAGLAQKGHSGMDADLVEQYLTVHEESGLRILVAPSTPQYAEGITVYTVEQVIESLRENYQYVIVDTPSQLQDTTLAALDAASTILVLTTLDLLALHKTKTALEMLRQLYVADKIQVILNRANSEVGIKIDEVESALGVTLRGQIPSDGKIVVTSVNEGRPFVLSAPTSVIARRITSLAQETLGREGVTGSGKISDEPERSNFLKRWFNP
ncbi:MAG: response regulator [Abitibacteriaceae bacterium]|nr:response regulator [Abditibacteriaceae bacterium]MBV9867575.1 response regulator [Abditibacteriaceae bacterium]